MSVWTKSPRFYGVVAIVLGLIGEFGLFAVTLVAAGSWTNWVAFISPDGLQWVVIAWPAPSIAVAFAVIIAPRMPQMAIGVCIMAALFYAYTSLAVSVLFGVVGFTEVPAMFATCLVAAAISRDRVPSAAGMDEGAVQHLNRAVLIGRVFGGTAFAVAGVLILFAVYALSLGIATLNVGGVVYSLVYVMLCMPAVPLLLLGRRVWGKSRRPTAG